MIAPMRTARRDGLYLRGRTWWMSYQVGGRRIRESTGLTDQKTAELVLAKVNVGIKEGKWFGKRKEVRTPLCEAVDNFLGLYSRVRKTSCGDDEVVLRRFCKYAGANAILQQLDRFFVERFLNSLQIGRASCRERVCLYV